MILKIAAGIFNMIEMNLSGQNSSSSGVVIYCDNREMKSKVYPILKNRCTIQEKSLDVGDYLLSERTGAERKSARDFIQSITDGRLFSQLAAMKSTFECPLLVIEGEGLFDTPIKMHPNAIRGALASVAVEFAVPIIWTKNALETAEMLFAIAKREQIHLKKDVAIRGKRRMRSMNEQQEFFLSGLPKISSLTAKKLLKRFGTPRGVFNATESELQEVEGIGKELSAKILKVLTSKYEKSILED